MLLLRLLLQMILLTADDGTVTNEDDNVRMLGWKPAAAVGADI